MVTRSTMRATASRGRYLSLVAMVVAATAGVASLLVWDTERQSAQAVENVAIAQGALARSLAITLRHRLDGLDSAQHATALEALWCEVSELGSPRSTLLLLGSEGAWHGPTVSLPPAVLALTHGASAHLVLPRDEAVALGLPPRRAVVAWEPTVPGQPGVLIIASAHLERAHAAREELVSTLGLLLVVALVLGLGVTAVRRESERQRLEYVIERKQLERERDEQLARAERIGVASALSIGIAHELATPLGVIAARVETLKRLSDERTQPALAVIAEQVNAMRQVMQGFLAFSRGDAPQVVSSSPEELARTAARAVLHRFSSAQVELKLELAPSLPEVRVDPQLVRQALVNLLVNAAQASAPGERVQLKVGASATMLEFQIVDRGHGVPSAISDQLMRPFVTTRAHEGGTGLGLAITQELARHHGGSVTLLSNPSGTGATATLRLPLSSGATS